MKKNEFLAHLRHKLYQLPPQEIEQTLEYYSEMIDDYIESGYSPKEAVAKMGTPEAVAAQILGGTRVPATQAPVPQKRNRSGLTVCLLILGFPLWFPLLVTAFSLLLVLAVVLATVCIIVPWSLVVSFGASGIGLLVVTPIVFAQEGIASAALTLGVAFVLAALCIFFVWIGKTLTKLAARAIGATFRGFFKLLFGRR